MRQHDNFQGPNEARGSGGHGPYCWVFNESMTGLTRSVEAAVAPSYDFSPFAEVVDVGADTAAFSPRSSGANPRAKGVLFDAPQVVEGTRRRLQADGLEGRYEAVGGGDFFAVGPDRRGPLYPQVDHP